MKQGDSVEYFDSHADYGPSPAWVGPLVVTHVQFGSMTVSLRPPAWARSTLAFMADVTRIRPMAADSRAMKPG